MQQHLSFSLAHKVQHPKWQKRQNKVSRPQTTAWQRETHHVQKDRQVDRNHKARSLVINAPSSLNRISITSTFIISYPVLRHILSLRKYRNINDLWQKLNFLQRQTGMRHDNKKILTVLLLEMLSREHKEHIQVSAKERMAESSHSPSNTSLTKISKCKLKVVFSMWDRLSTKDLAYSSLCVGEKNKLNT